MGHYSCTLIGKFLDSLSKIEKKNSDFIKMLKISIPSVFIFVYNRSYNLNLIRFSCVLFLRFCWNEWAYRFRNHLTSIAIFHCSWLTSRAFVTCQPNVTNKVFVPGEKRPRPRWTYMAPRIKKIQRAITAILNIKNWWKYS